MSTFQQADFVILNFVRRFRDFLSQTQCLGRKYNVSLETPLQQGISESVQISKKKWENLTFRSDSEYFKINRYKRIDYSLDIMR